MPEDFGHREQSFAIWDDEPVSAYVAGAKRQGNVPSCCLTSTSFACLNCRTIAPITPALLGELDAIHWAPKQGRPCAGFLFGTFTDEFYASCLRGQRWLGLMKNVSAYDWLCPLYLVCGQRPGDSLWDMLVRRRLPAEDPDPYWRLNI